MIVYWSSASRNTARFVAGLDWPCTRILNQGEVLVMDRPFVLITPTFADGEGRGAVPKPVIRFLNVASNRERMLGVIGSGNRNFGDTFSIAADVISAKCNIPVLYRFELAGTSRDTDVVHEGLTRLWQHHNIEPMPQPMSGK